MGSIAHGLLAAVTLVALAAEPQPGDYTQNCTTASCHGDLTKRPVVHDPVRQDSCDACHEAEDGAEHGFTLTTDAQELCYECHDDPEGANVHPPVAEGQCTACHDPHGAAVKFLLTAPTVSEVCTDCHDELLEDLAFLHGPVAAGACTACHNPHASDLSSLLKRESVKLCTACHETIANRIGTLPHKHPPATEDCTTCHNPHGAGNKMMLNASPPDLCFECHDDIAELAEDATVKHDALTIKKSCSNCHDAHGSTSEHLLSKKPLELCLSCHGKSVKSDGRTLIDIAQKLEDNPRRHGPVGEGDCATCHSPHGGEQFRLLAGAYPSTFYSPFSEDAYALCFTCHDVEAFEDEETDELTDFRNGERNLHFLHVNRETKGRTCRACHDVHASRHPKHITDNVPFGAWSLPIQFVKNENGGSCAPGCHNQYRYDRESPVTNIPKP